MVAFVFIFIHTLISLQELGKGSIIVDELSVRADLCDLAIHHHHNDITLREESNPMGHKDTNLNKKQTNINCSLKFTNLE